MEEQIKALQIAIDFLRGYTLQEAKSKLDLEMKLFKAERGNETLQERIKEKDLIIDDLKEIVNLLKPVKGGKQEEKPKN